MYLILPRRNKSESTFDLTNKKVISKTQIFYKNLTLISKWSCRSNKDLDINLVLEYSYLNGSSQRVSEMYNPTWSYSEKVVKQLLHFACGLIPNPNFCTIFQNVVKITTCP